MDIVYKSLKHLVKIIFIFFCFSLYPGYAQTEDPFDIQTEIIPSDIQQKENEENLFKIRAEVLPAEISPGEEAIFTVTFEIAAGYYLYADKTDITPKPVSGLIFGKIKKPEGIKKENPYLGTIFMYEGHIAIQIPVLAEKSVGLGKKPVSFTIDYQGCSQKMCFLPQQKQMNVELGIQESGVRSKGSEARGQKQGVRNQKSEVSQQLTANSQQPTANTNSFQKTAEQFGILGVLVAAFVWGFLASLTPCVYPMIPVTVSVIGAGSSGNVLRGFLLSVVYVLGLSLTYAIFGTIAAWSGGLFGAYASHPVVRVIVAGVFVLLALGMFDIFYIQMPSAVSSRLGSYKGSGVIGIFLTGAVAGAVVGPCVGPMLVGLLIYIAALGSKFQGFLIMWSFALGMGMLFLAIGTFSGVAASMPKAGKWMEKIKHFFGVLMLAVALYYVMPLFSENVFALILGSFLIGIGIFTGALDRISTEATKLDRFWKTAGIIFLVLGIGYVINFTMGDRLSQVRVEPQKTGIVWLTDETSAVAQAKGEKKPVIIDFTADWCPVCKRLDHETFSHPSVIEASKAFVCLRIDCTNTKDPKIKSLQAKYHVIGLPTVIFLDPSGNPLLDKAITEFIKPNTFLMQMQEITGSVTN